MSESKRIEFIDLAKGICILLVLAVHIVPEVGKRFDLLTGLRMPLYFCLSGLFFKDYGGIKNLLIRKADKLLLPFFSWYLISYAFYYFRIYTLGEASENFHILDFFTRPYFYNLPLWFLLCLFWSNLLYAFITKLTDNLKLQSCLILIFLFFGWELSFSGYPNWFFIGTSLTCLPFFFLGRILKDSPIIRNKTLRTDLICLICGIFVIVAVSLISKETLFMSYYNNYLEKGHVFSLYLIAAPMVILTLLACKYIKKVPYISFLGRYSIIALITHELLRNVINRGIRFFINPELSDFQINLIVMIIVCAIMPAVIVLCRKYLPYITAQKDFLTSKILLKNKPKENFINTLID